MSDELNLQEENTSEPQNSMVEPALFQMEEPVEQKKNPVIFADDKPFSNIKPPVSEAEKNGVKHKQTVCCLVPAQFPRDCSLGDLLVAARKCCGLNIESVADMTRIRLDYLTLLEKNTLHEKLPYVYLSAYVRTLCGVYGLDADSRTFVMEKLSGLQENVDVPQTLVEKVENDIHVNEEEERRVRRIMWSISCVIVVLILGIAAWITIAISRSGTKKDSSAAVSVASAPAFPEKNPDHIDDAEFETLIAPETPRISILKMSSKPAIAR